jgi:hypothetical protein
MVLASVVLSSCNSSTKSEPETNLNKCTRYACPIHSDKTSATMEKCPKCDASMILLPDSLINDSVKNYKK